MDVIVSSTWLATYRKVPYVWSFSLFNFVFNKRLTRFAKQIAQFLGQPVQEDKKKKKKKKKIDKKWIKIKKYLNKTKLKQNKNKTKQNKTNNNKKRSR